MSFVTDIKTFAALGSGVIGSGWVARALANGLDVVAWDPAPGAEAQLRARIAKCWGALEQQGLKAGASPERLRFVATLEEFLDVSTLCLIIVIFNLWSHAHFLDHNVGLVLSRFPSLLCNFVLVFSEIHNLANGWIGIWCDLN